MLDRHGIQSRVLMLQGAGWVASLILVATVGWMGVAAARDQTREQRRLTATVVARHVDQVLAADLERVQRLSAMPELDLADGVAQPERAAVRRAYQRSTLIDTVSLLDASGRILAAEPAQANAVPADPAAVAETLRVAHPTTHVLPAEGAPRASILVPLRDRRSQLVAVAYVVFDARSRAMEGLLDTAGAAIVEGKVPPGAIDVRLTSLPWSVAIPENAPETAAQLVSIRNAIAWASPLLLLLGALFAWGTAFSVRRPVLALTAAAERMTGGDLDTPLPDLPDDEVGRLGRVLEHLRVSARASIEAIEEANEQLEQRVKDRTRELEQMCRRLHDRDEWRVQVLRKVISAQEDERRRLARELHDDTCQSLAALGVSVDALLAEGLSGEARTRLLTVKELVNASLADLHRVIYDLRPSVLDDLGLPSAIRWLVAQHLERRGVNARCEFSGLEARLAPEVETAIFRVVQEALTNVERHARADNVLVQATLDEGLLTIEIEDDGEGFDVPAAPVPGGSGRGLGLLGMRERVELLGGSCFVDSSPGRGTRVVVTVPYANARVEEGTPRA